MEQIENQTYNKHVRSYLMGIAMLLVVFYHFSMHDEYSNPVQKAFNYIFGHGFVGVEMFFLLSAYGLCYSYNNNSLKVFYTNRFVRLMPLYPLALILTYLRQGVPYGHHMFEVFVEQMTGIALFTDVKDPLWYIEGLILLYMFFPFIFRFCRKLQNLGGGVFLILFLCSLFHLALIVIPDFYLQRFVGRIPMIIVGVMTFLYDKDNDTGSKYLLYGGLALLAIAPIFNARFFFVPAAMLLIAKTNVVMGFSGKILCFIGVHTFEIFIAHHFSQMTIRYFDNYYIALAVFSAITVALSVLFFYFQNYSVKLIRKFL